MDHRQRDGRENKQPGDRPSCLAAGSRWGRNPPCPLSNGLLAHALDDHARQNRDLRRAIAKASGNAALSGRLMDFFARASPTVERPGDLVHERLNP